MSTTSTLSVEERLMRLESLLERLIAATPAASNTAASAAETEPSTATNTSNDEHSAFTNAHEWKDDTRAGLNSGEINRAGPMPRLSILKQESTNAANDQLMLSNHTSRVIIDPTRIPAVIESY